MTEKTNNSTYWVHRTTLCPLVLNIDYKKNNLPILLSFVSYNNLLSKNNIKNVENFEFLPNNLWSTNDEEASINHDIKNYLKKQGITKTEYLKCLKQNYHEQLNAYFNNGLYIQRPRISTTATFLSDNKNIAKQKLEQIIKKDNFGFQNNNTILSLSDRAQLNTILLLEIPKNCTSIENIQPVFQVAKKSFSTLTAYFGVQELKTVIPSQYIKCGYIVEDGKIFKILNQIFDKTYTIKEGVFDEDTLVSDLEYQLSTQFDFEKITKLSLLLSKNFDKTKSKNTLSYLEKILTFAKDNNTKPKIKSFCNKLEKNILNYKKNLMTPIEYLSHEFAETDINKLTEEQAVEIIINYISNTKHILKNTFFKENFQGPSFNEFENIQHVVNIIYDKYYNKLKFTKYYNDLFGKIGMFSETINMKNDLYKTSQSLYEQKILSDQETSTTYIEEENIINNKNLLLNYALCSDINKSNKIFKVLKEKDFSKISYTECVNIINNLENNEKTI